MQFVTIPGNDKVASFQMATTPILEPDGKPKVNMSWYDAITYCNALSVSHNLEKCYNNDGSTWVKGANGFRLPTEAEWVLAAEKDPDESELDKYAWYNKNSNSTLQVAAQLLPNEFGLYDMRGNIWEWCYDAYPKFFRIMRGGAFGDDASSLWMSYRISTAPLSRIKALGVRLVRNIENQMISIKVLL